MMQYIHEADELRDQFDCVVLIVHHTGHVETGRARGSSAFKAALDLEVNVASGVMSCTKAKESEPFEPLAFEIQPIDLDGDGLMSAAIHWSGASIKASRTIRISPRLQQALDSLRDVCIADGVEMPDERVGVHVELWRDHFYRSSTADDVGAKKKAFQRVRTRLVEMGGKRPAIAS
jgi:hypothetical protein